MCKLTGADVSMFGLLVATYDDRKRCPLPFVERPHFATISSDADDNDLRE